MGVPYAQDTRIDTRYATAHSIHLYSAHRAVVFAIAQLSCLRLVGVTKMW